MVRYQCPSCGPVNLQYFGGVSTNIAVEHGAFRYYYRKGTIVSESILVGWDRLKDTCPHCQYELSVWHRVPLADLHPRNARRQELGFDHQEENARVDDGAGAMRLHVSYHIVGRHCPWTGRGEWHCYDVGEAELDDIIEQYDGVIIEEWGMYASPRHRNLRKQMQRMVEETW